MVAASEIKKALKVNTKILDINRKYLVKVIFFVVLNI